MHPTNPQETIAAQATAKGRAGVAIVRISGPQVKNIMRTLLKCDLNPRQATYLPFVNASGETLDEGIAIYFPNPNSFTGEDVLELHGHGGAIVVDRLLQEILLSGARLARPGEFSERAFLNGKMDLAQAEAVSDLIHASSVQAARSAMRSLQGEFSKKINALNEKIIRLRTYIEAAIDFSDEEIDFLQEGRIFDEMKTILSALEKVECQAKQGSRLREGMTVVIVGEPNVGKSSLLNCLSGKEVAIVTDIPGTTRDVLRDDILIDGMPLHILDTAGLRESADVVEQEGIKRAYREMEQADLVLYMLDASLPESKYLGEQKARIFIHNKIDLMGALPSIKKEGDNTHIFLSVKSGAGIDLLKQHIKAEAGFNCENEDIFLARRRHLDALSHTKIHLQHSLRQLTESKSPELSAEDLRLAHLSLATITGTFTPDDLLGQIFSTFCVGK